MLSYIRIKDACRTTGLSTYFLRKGCKDDSFPGVRCSDTYYINVPALLEQLNAANCKKAGGFENVPSAGVERASDGGLYHRV